MKSEFLFYYSQYSHKVNKVPPLYAEKSPSAHPILGQNHGISGAAPRRQDQRDALQKRHHLRREGHARQLRRHVRLEPRGRADEAQLRHEVGASAGRHREHLEMLEQLWKITILNGKSHYFYGHFQ